MTVSPTASDRILTYERRVERVARRIDELGLGALLVTNPENRRYLSGFTGHDSGADSAGALLVTGAQVTLLTDGRYTEQAEGECSGVRVVRRDGDFAALAAQLLRESGAGRAGFEAAHLTVASRDDLDSALAAGEGARPELVPTRQVVERLRVVKDAAELDAIERAVAITDETFLHLTGYLQPGLTERQVAREVERYMLEHGAEGLAFDTMVASGPNAALPHATPTERALALGEPIIIDMGARYGGYCSDMTRTVCLGEPGAEAQRIYEAVLRAQEACVRGLRPGLNGKEADALARDALAQEGYGEQFLHGLGHGLGLEIHEDPRLKKTGEEYVLEPGMAVTVEPGAYLTGWGGVRIEDTVVVTEDGARVLTKSPKRFSLPR